MAQSLAGVPVINVFHLRQVAGGSWSLADMQSAVSFMRQTWLSNIVSLQNPALTLGTLTGTDLSSSLGVVAVQGGSNAGGAAGTAVTANVAACVSWPIARHYRGGHPRTYIGGLATGNVLNANSWTPAFVTALTAGMVSFRGTVNTNTVNSTGPVELVCVHRILNKIHLPVPTVDAVGVPSMDTRVDSQRRRLGRDR